ncbi:hypothetical protein NDU88_002394 [Pleurodeles waltl]|uniref:Uncharacterized protein n=1 Tax=Pleurodeles waltl TaxID=8319 RepID=A0AAV7KS34_PLEWA|nr:hypothetical protein NDU88_002394 [Pleurodeles waltl]
MFMPARWTFVGRKEIVVGRSQVSLERLRYLARRAGEPRAAGQSSSAGRQAKRTLAADVPEVWCGGMGFAPAGASGEQRPGPSGMRGGPAVRLVDVELRVEWQQKRAQAAEVPREDLWCEEECVLDFEERSFEEGELVDKERGGGLVDEQWGVWGPSIKGADEIVPLGKTDWHCLLQEERKDASQAQNNRHCQARRPPARFRE